MPERIVQLHETGTLPQKTRVTLKAKGGGFTHAWEPCVLWRGMRRSIIRAQGRARRLLAKNPAYFHEG